MAAKKPFSLAEGYAIDVYLGEKNGKYADSARNLELLFSEFENHGWVKRPKDLQVLENCELVAR